MLIFIVLISKKTLYNNYKCICIIFFNYYILVKILTITLLLFLYNFYMYILFLYNYISFVFHDSDYNDKISNIFNKMCIFSLSAV